MFNLEKAIRNWKRNLRKNPAFEDGDIAELESHLQDEIDRLMAEGLSEKEAFEGASQEIGKPELLNDEMGKIRSGQKYPSHQKGFLNVGLMTNYLVVSIRALKKNKGFSILNIVGLAIGIWACLAIYLVIQDDFSYDRFHENADQIYRIEDEIILPENGELVRRSRTPMPWAKALKEELPEIIESGRMMKSGGDLLFRIEDQSYNESDFLYVDNSLIDIFSFKFLSGNKNTPLEQPNTAVLSRTFATKYFGEQNPIGQTIISEVGWYGPVEYEVTAVIEDLPPNSHFQQGIFLSFPTLEFQLFNDINENWNIHFYYTYLLLNNDTDMEAFDTKLDQFVTRHYDEERAARYNPELIGLTDIYLHSQGSAQLGAVGSIEYVYAESIIAIFILLIALFNFVNLSTAQSFERAKEVGMRKVLGANRFSLIRQYLSESVAYCFIATLLALVFLYFTVPFINILSGKSLQFDIVQLVSLLPLVAAGVLITGVLAGLYPALFLSSFSPSVIFKGMSGTGNKTQWIRKSLVGFQFAISVFLIISTIVVYQQLNYLKERDLGFDKSQLMEIKLLSRDVIKDYPVLKSNLLQLGSVQNVTSSTGGVGGELYYNSYRFEDTPEGPVRKTMARYAVDSDYFSTMGVPLIAGRKLTEAFNSDSSGSVVINEAAVNELGWENPSEALGTRITYTRPNEELISATIIAVSKNFHLESPHQEVEPMVMEYWNEALSALIVKVSDVSGENIEQIQQAYHEVLPSLPFEFTFMDERINNLYSQEDQIGTFFYWFALLAIFIACLGLFGVAAYAIDRRTKEIGIRKVLGADFLQIIGMLSKDFLRLVAVAFVVASPLAWYAMNGWLNDFAYRIELSAGIFLLAGLLVTTIALISISWHSIKAALMNPVKSLKSE